MREKAFPRLPFRVAHLVCIHQPEGSVLPKLAFEFIDGVFIDIGVAGQCHEVPHIVQFDVIGKVVCEDICLDSLQPIGFGLADIGLVVVYKHYMPTIILQVMPN